MKSTLSIPPVSALLATTVLLAACVPATAPAPPTAPVPRSSVCEDPLYLELRASAPDALTEREWTRLQQLEELCVLDRRTAEALQPGGEDAAHRADQHSAMWLWMPAMMVFGGLMWLMMGT